jgi:hypothetical protein
MTRKFPLMAVVFVTAIALTFGSGAAHAQLYGPKVLTAFGGVGNGPALDGNMALAGWMNLTKKGGAKAVSVTVTSEISPPNNNGTVCTFTDPSDVSYSFPNGLDSAGTLTLTLAADDPDCYEMADLNNTRNEAGASITFAIYRVPGVFSLVGLETNLVNINNIPFSPPIPVSGVMSSVVGFPVNRLIGVKLFNAIGGTSGVTFPIPGPPPNGHIALAGRATLDGKGGAKALDLTLNYFGSEGTMTCQLTNPSDLSYTVSKGVGTLTLEPSASDSNCMPNEAGKSITFALYAVGRQTRLIATSSSLVDTQGDIIDSIAMSGSMSVRKL